MYQVSPLVVVDAPEAERAAPGVHGRAVAPELVASGGGVDVVAGVDRQGVDQPLDPGAHRGQVLVGAVEVALLSGEIGMHGRSQGARRWGTRRYTPRRAIAPLQLPSVHVRSAKARSVDMNALRNAIRIVMQVCV